MKLPMFLLITSDRYVVQIPVAIFDKMNFMRLRTPNAIRTSEIERFKQAKEYYERMSDLIREEKTFLTDPQRNILVLDPEGDNVHEAIDLGYIGGPFTNKASLIGYIKRYVSGKGKETELFDPGKVIRF